MNNTTFEERLAMRLVQMDKEVKPKQVITNEQRMRYNKQSLKRYYNKTLESERIRNRERYHIKHPDAKYYAITDAEKEDKKIFDDIKEDMKKESLWAWVES